MTDATASAGPPVLATEDTPAFDGWGSVEPNLAAAMGVALDDIDPEATEDVAEDLHAVLAKLGVRHIVHYDGPEQSITVRLDKSAAVALSALLAREAG